MEEIFRIRKCIYVGYFRLVRKI